MKLSKPVKGYVHLSLRSGGDLMCAADIYDGVWAIHRSIENTCWTVTHVSTGQAAGVRALKPAARELLGGLLAIQPAESWAKMYVRGKRLCGISRKVRQAAAALSMRP